MVLNSALIQLPFIFQLSFMTFQRKYVSIKCTILSLPICPLVLRNDKLIESMLLALGMGGMEKEWKWNAESVDTTSTRHPTNWTISTPWFSNALRQSSCINHPNPRGRLSSSPAATGSSVPPFYLQEMTFFCDCAVTFISLTQPLPLHFAEVERQRALTFDFQYGVAKQTLNDACRTSRHRDALNAGKIHTPCQRG